MLSYGTALGEQLQVHEFALLCECPACHKTWQGAFFLLLDEMKLPPATIPALCVTCAEKHVEAIAIQTRPKWAFEPIPVESFKWPTPEAVSACQAAYDRIQEIRAEEVKAQATDHCDCAPAGWGDLWGHKPTCNTQRAKR